MNTLLAMTDQQPPVPEQIPDNVRELGVSQEYFDKIHGLYIAAREQDFMAFFRMLQDKGITVNL